MGIHRGPNMEKGGLIFGYDSGHGVCDNHTSSRFYQGKPTTNYLSDGLSSYNVVQGSRWNGATPTFTKGMSEFNTLIGTYNTSGTSYMYSHDYVLDDDLSTLSSQVVTFSIYLRRTDTLGTVGMRIYDNVSGYSTIYADVTNQFQRFSITKTLGANPTRIFIMIDNSNGGIIDFHSPMLEKGEASPFVDGTRSSTNSLIDLKRTTDIDVSNVSFDSTGQPTFDGTDDYISLPNKLGYPTNSVSVFAWFKINGSPTGGYHIICGTSNLEMSIHSSATYLRNGVETTNGRFVSNNGSQTLNDGNYHYYGFTFDGSTKTAYIDGVVVGTQSVTGTLTTSFSTRRVGAYGGSYFANGDLPVYKVYNKVLTPEEAKQSYNVHKNRFDI
jgi:hypothetical protein